MQHIEKFLDYIKYEKRFSVHTYISYKADIEQFSQFVESNYNCTAPVLVNHKMIRQWIVLLLNNGHVPRSVNRKLSALKTFFKFLLRQGIVAINPLDKVTAPKVKKRLPVFVDQTNMDTLIDKVDFDQGFEGQRNKLIIEMFYHTGIRLSELIGLKDEDIDHNSCNIKVLGKRNRERIIPVTFEFSEEIKKYQQVRSEIGASPNFLFVGKTGKKMYPVAVQRIIKAYLGLVTSIEKKSPHVLRHTFATHMLNNGAALTAIKDLLGHANLSATQVYTHNTFEKLTRVYKQAHPRA